VTNDSGLRNHLDRDVPAGEPGEIVDDALSSIHFHGLIGLAPAAIEQLVGRHPLGLRGVTVPHDVDELENCLGRVLAGGVALKKVQRDRRRMRAWRGTAVPEGALKPWVNGQLSERWGKKAAARVYHICTSGQDVDFAAPFAPGAATEKPTKHSGKVPGSESPARTLFGVSQALSWVATRRNNAEERVERQSEIAALVQKLHEFRVKPSREHNSGNVMS
jgi:hypothetical protein